MGLLDMAQATPQQPQAHPQGQQPPGGNPLQAAIVIAHEVMYGDPQRTQLMVQRLTDGKGDALDEAGEFAAQATRSTIRTARKRGTPVPPQGQIQLLAVVASMATELAEKLGLIEGEQQEPAARQVLDAADRYFRQYGAQDNQRGAQQSPQGQQAQGAMQ
ncbi:hypothetical protein [Chitinilyticum litopenaei]|uniref:hypothetical protein n=1 Tax=Chitinilyticum litopenaei TaxID=1121276 RepID=UPI0003F6883F|nr:hypothetical protein [Chitinilyticum litopenaei]